MAKLFLISGPSGCGKTSIMRELMSNEVVSFTTREKRKGEKDGIDYLFITKDEFQRLDRSGGLIESVEYDNNYYGITKEELHEKTETPAFCIVDFNGMQQLRKIHDNTTSIFLYTDYETAKINMLERGDDVGKVEKRLSTFYREMENKGHYDYVVKNIEGNLKNTIGIVELIIIAEAFRTPREVTG